MRILTILLLCGCELAINCLLLNVFTCTMRMTTSVSHVVLRINEAIYIKHYIFFAWNRIIIHQMSILTLLTFTLKVNGKARSLVKILVFGPTPLFPFYIWLVVSRLNIVPQRHQVLTPSSSKYCFIWKITIDNMFNLEILQ